MSPFELLIVGAGPVGCVVAERAATQLNWKSVIVEARSHIAGNCFDRVHESGILIHVYGPHYFRTNSTDLIEYLSAFTDWIPGNYIVKSFTKGSLFPFPINLLTLEKFFDRKLTATEAESLLSELREKIDSPANSEEFVLSRVGRELYEAFYLGYTLKQWGRSPKELSPSVCGRIPIRLNTDERYVDHKFQVMPAKGFTALFSKMIDHPNITVLLNTNFHDVKSKLTPKHATLYCGPIDDYFDNCLGPLPWRSMEFKFELLDKELEQPCVQINYPNDFEYTRSVEIKHVTRQKHENTLLCYEFPSDTGDPYYPVPSETNNALYRRYEALAEEETKKAGVFFAGRLANYRYMNTDEAIEKALRTFQEIKNSVSKQP